MGKTHALGHAFHITSDFIAAFDPEAVGNLIGDKSQSAVFDNAKIKAFVTGFAANDAGLAPAKR